MFNPIQVKLIERKDGRTQYCVTSRWGSIVWASPDCKWLVALENKHGGLMSYLFGYQSTATIYRMDGGIQTEIKLHSDNGHEFKGAARHVDWMRTNEGWCVRLRFGSGGLGTPTFLQLNNSGKIVEVTVKEFEPHIKSETASRFSVERGGPSDTLVEVKQDGAKWFEVQHKANVHRCCILPLESAWVWSQDSSNVCMLTCMLK
jgi:hypothetical protein